jgi:ubiquinone/menaquinone biosynthesis C-methylase UbiE
MNYKTEDARQRETLKTLTSFLRKFPRLKPEKYLDLGCSDGSFTLKVANLLNAQEVYGVDRVGEILAEAKRKGIKVYVADLNTDRLPFADGEFDVVSAFEVVEHLWNPGNMLNETYRVLKNKGLFILTTPNMASWINRFLLFFGYLPYAYECPGKYEEDLEKRPFQKYPTCFGHTRLYTFKTLSKLLNQYGFNIIYSSSYAMGYVQKNAMILYLERIFSKLRKNLGSGILLVATKE